MKGCIPTAEPCEIAKHRDDRRNAWIAQAGLIPRAGDGVHALNRVNRNIVNGVRYDDRQSNAIRDVVKVMDGVDPADVEGVERTARLAGGIVFRHGNVNDVGVTVGLGRAAHGTTVHAAAAARDYKQCREKNSKQNSRSHRISSCNFPFRAGCNRPWPTTKTLTPYVHVQTIPQKRNCSSWVKAKKFCGICPVTLGCFS